ncbi:hypothetical protein [Mycovorax composti]|jgi:hypothetical protein
MNRTFQMLLLLILIVIPVMLFIADNQKVLKTGMKYPVPPKSESSGKMIYLNTDKS